MRLAVDVMSGDFGPRIAVPAAMVALERFPFLELDLIGDKALIQAYTYPHLLSRYRILHCSRVISQEESVASVLRDRNDSTMSLALALLAEGRVDGVVSAGNTGALMALGVKHIKCQPQLKRPAICAQLPRQDGCFFLADCGANISVTSKQLRDFALMASALATHVEGVQRPRVALLNVGTEELKGTSVVKKAAALIEADARLNFVGFVEGDHLFDSNVDVVVCDGFVGNVALKTTEGLALHVRDRILQSVSRGWRRLFTPLTKALLYRVVNWLNPRRYNGAMLLGLEQVVVKSHGSANTEAFLAAIDCARRAVEAQLPASIRSVLEETSDIGE